MRKYLITAELRDLEFQVTKGEISYSRMIEILCEKADEYAKTHSSQTNERLFKMVEKTITAGNYDATTAENLESLSIELRKLTGRLKSATEN